MDLTLWSASRIARAVHAGEIEAREVFDAARARIERLDPALRAFTELHDFQPPRDGPLAGVPIAVKRTAQVERLRAAGAVVVGRTSVPGPGTSWQTWGQTDRGPTENPWRSGLTPGGSSAGSAA
ncbi:amidase family protein, partial [Actinocorallia lasiicapitis]